MADPNPYAQYANPYAVYGTPKRPPAQTEAQATGDTLRNARTAQEIENNPLDRQSKETNIAQGQQAVQFGPSKQADDLIKSFRADPAVKAYRESEPVIIAATQAARNGAGDLSVVYGWAKTMDPSGSVREGDTDLAQSASGPMQRAQFLVSQYRLQEGGTLPPEVRFGLIEEMRNKGRQLNLQYSQVYQQYRNLLRQSGLPENLLGPHEGDKFRNAEEQYVRSINGPRQGPTDPSYTGEVQPRLSNEPQVDVGYKLTPEQQAAYDQLVASGANADQLRQLIQGFGGRLETADAIVKARDAGAGYQSAENAIYRLPEDLQQRTDERLANTGSGGAAAAGVADTVTMGTFDELSALGDAFGDVLSGKPFDYQGNLAANRQFQQGLQERDSGAYLGGQLAGGLVLPTFGARTAAQLAGVGAGYGAAYGAGSGEDPRSRALGALTGAGAGGATGYAIGRVPQFFSRSAKEVPPLVDPATGELNQPLDAMRPAQRVQAIRDAGIETVTPGMAGGRSARVIEQGFNNLPGSAGTMEDINSAASGELRRGMQNVAQKFGSSKTLNEGGAELQRGAQQYIDRAKAVTGKAYDAIPISPEARASTSATVATLEGLTQKFGSNPELAKQMNSPKIQQMLDAIKGDGLSWQDLKALRTSIGERIGERRFTDDTATSDLRAVYAALSEDMQNTAAAMGPRASAAFNRANNLYRETQNIIDKSLVTILGNDAAKSPEKAAAAVQAMTKGGKSTGDLKTLAQIRAATIKSGAWDEIASTLIHLGGQPANSEGRAFQPDTFVRWYADMSEPARKMLFKPELRKELEKFVAVNQQLSRLKGLNNTSQTAPVMFGGSALLTAASALVNPLLGVKLGGVLAGNYAMGKLWTNPTFVRWATGYTKAAATGNQNAVKSQIGRLQKIATTNPELRQGVEALIRNLANDNAAQSGKLAASPDQGPDQQQ